MAINAEQTFSLDLSTFGGIVKDVAAGNAPAGVSVSCSDMFFSAQYTATRPAFMHALAASLVSGEDINSHLDYPQQDGTTDLVLLYGDGSLWTEKVETGATTQIATVSKNTRFKGTAAFNKFFMAFRSLSLTSSFTSAQLAGGDVPRYINQLGHVWRVTTDAPGGGFSVQGVTIAPEDLVTPGAWVTGPAVDSITLTDLKTISINVPHIGVRTINYYTTATVVLGSAITLAAGQLVQLYNIKWANPGGPQWANGVPVAAAVVSSTTFKVNIGYTQQANSATVATFAVQAGSGSITLTRDSNTVTAYLAGTSPGTPTEIQPGWFVSLVDTQASSNAAVPISGAVPFTDNELFQAIYPSSATSGTAAQWLNGAVMTFYTYAHSNGGAFNFDYPGDGFNETLPTPIATYTFADDLGGVMITPNGNPDINPTLLPGAPNTYGHLPWELQGVNSSGDWDGNSITPFAGATTDVAAVISGFISFPAAGTYTFFVANDDGIQVGFSSAVTVVSTTGNVGGGNFNPQPHTKTALNGYPIAYAENASTNYGGVNIYFGSVTVSVAGPTVAGVEINYVNWEGNATCIFMNYISSTTVPMQPTVGPASATIQGDGAGNIHVTLPTGSAVEDLPIGSWLYLFLNAPVSNNVVDWTISSNGTGTITVQNGSFEVGEEVLLDGFTSVSNPEPTGWNGQTVTINAVQTNETDMSQLIQFLWNGPSGSGTTTTGTATPVTVQYPSGFVQITQVINTGEFVYAAVGNTSTQKATGTVYDYFGSLNTQQSLTAALPGTSTIESTLASANSSNSASGIVQGFQVLTVDTTKTPNVITWFQSGFNDSYTGTHTLQVQPQAQMAGGPRSMLMFNINEDGAATPASYPINLQLNGGTQFAQVTLPLGPAGTVARATAWTPAYGTQFYALAPGNVPAAAGNAPIISTGTIVYDNTTTSTIIDFSDAALVDGISVGPVDANDDSALSDDYGDLTSTIVLPPCIGVIEYNQQLIWWGELNNYPNHSMVNMGFDGNYDGTLTLGVSAQPLGWDNKTEYNSLTPSGTGILFNNPNGLGFAYGLPTAGATTLSFVIYSPADGVLASTTFPVSGFTSASQWYSGTFSAAMPATIPPDAVIYITLTSGHGMISQSVYQNYYGTPILLPNRTYVIRFEAFTATVNSLACVALDELEIIDAAQPVLNNQLRVSYPDNEFGYDNENGFVVGLDTSDFIAAMFIQRSFLYALTQGIGQLHTIQSNAQLPDEWGTNVFAQECGCSGPNAVATGESIAWWMGRNGVHVFEGQKPKKISQPVTQDFEITNWNAAVNSCMGYDAVQRVLYMSYPTGAATDPNFTHSMNFRLADAAYNVPDPIHVSAYTGKLISTDLAQKWCQIAVPFNSIENCVRQTPYGFAKVMTFAGGAVGPVQVDNSTATYQQGTDFLLIGLAPVNPTDFMVVCTSAFQTSSGNTPGGWTRPGGGFYTMQASSNVFTEFEMLNPVPSDWTAVMASFAATSPSVTSSAVLDFGNYPLTSYNHTITPTAGDMLMVQFSAFLTGSPTLTVTDSEGNNYKVLQEIQLLENGFYEVSYLAYALGVPGVSTTLTINISNATGSGSTGFTLNFYDYAGIDGPVSYGQLYVQDFQNYPPVNRSATTWNCVDDDYGTINWYYQTYFFFAHDVEQQAMLSLYRKLFPYFSMHVLGVGYLNVQPFVDNINNPWPALFPWTLALTNTTFADPANDYDIGLNVTGNRMSLRFSGTPVPETQGGDGVSTAMLLTHLVVSARKDLVFPVRGAF